MLHKAAVVSRPPGPIDGKTIWLPFVVVRRPLVEMRQRGHLIEMAIPPQRFRIAKEALTAVLGAPEYEDDSIVAFRRR